MLVKLFTASCFALASLLAALPAQAQALNPRWHGQWQSSEGTLTISDKVFRIDKENCRWSTSVPAKFTTCVAYYNSSVTRAALVADQEKAEKEVKVLLADKSMNAGQKAQISKSMASNRQALSQISNDTFKLVLFSDAERENGSGDCGNYLFLDKETIYMVLSCVPAPESFTIRPYKKMP